jgi:hypothetical protein
MFAVVDANLTLENVRVEFASITVPATVIAVPEAAESSKSPLEMSVIVGEPVMTTPFWSIFLNW